MKLVLATPLYPPDAGGPATYAKILFEGLPVKGIAVRLVKFGEVRHLPKGIRHIVYFWRVYRAARNADAILVQDTISCGVPAVCASKLARKHLFVRVPGDYAWEQGCERWGVSVDINSFQKIHFGWQVELLRLLQKWVVTSADAVLVPSEYFSHIVHGWGISKEKITVIYHGVSDAMAETIPKNLPSKPFMVSVGRLVPWKGFDFLISILNDLPEWSLVIVGDGPDKTRLEKIAEKEGVSDRVIFLGRIPRAGVFRWLARADAFVLATSFESFSFQVVEAMSVGAKIIVNAIGSIPELMTDKEGLLLTVGDKKAYVDTMRSIQNDKGLWEEKAHFAKERAKNFSEENMLAHTERWLNRLIAK